MRSKCITIIAVGVILAGCHRGTQTVVLSPPVIVSVPLVVPVAAPVPVPSDIPSSLPTVSSPPGLFEQAEFAFAEGDYDAAIQTYENYLMAFPSGDQTDQALFHLGIAYVLRNKPPANWTRATANLKRLVSEHPDSPLSPTANVILSLRKHADDLAKDAKARNEVVQQLSTELERLKKIDVDRRKRP
jgi:TolA-binding protein